MFVYGDRNIVGVEDLVLLTDISERGILKNLEQRFQKDEIYTYLGNVLIVCNPFRWLQLYDAGYIKKFNKGQLSELEPHIYAVAQRAFQEMLLEDFNQCVIISGESGAGKTEAAKQIMSYIAAVSGTGGNDTQVNKVKSIILDSNPALESFGNAMTLRNNNSSRFGKYFEITFAPNGAPMGGRITNFLLERGRLVHLGQGERSFHIFYQLITSNMNQIKQKLYLSNNPNDYRLLSMSGVTQVNNEGGRRDDARDFEETIQSLETVGVHQTTQSHFFLIAAAVLHLSNITFRDMKVNGAEGSTLGSQQAQDAVSCAAAVLQLNPQELLHNLTYRTLTTIAPGKGVETYQVPQNAVQASATRDSLAKDLYARVFDLLVDRVNMALKNTGKKTRGSVRRQMRQSMNQFNAGTLSIGVLDIYGFEIFAQNFFEQFCINYVNEKLQQVFIELTIRAEQEDYESEGIAWNKIPFFDNQIVCNLIEGKAKAGGGKKKFGKARGAGGSTGLFDVLNDTAKTITAMEASKADRRFQDTLFGVHGQHKHLQRAPAGFVIVHYAGNVTYTIDGFVDANRDTLSKELRLMLKNSGEIFVTNLYPEVVDFNDKTMPPSASTKVKTQANDLITRLKMCEPHYVRCIKSNSRKAPKIFEGPMVGHQVKYLNLLENVKIRRAGFAYRVKFLDFNRKFKVLGLGVVDTNFYARASPYDITMKFMQVAAARVPALNQPGEVQLGQTKLFIKTPEVLFELQRVRRALLGDVATKIQRFYKFYKTQRKLFDMKTYMISLFEKAGKPTTPVDVLGNYQAFYIDDPNTKQWMDDILNYYRDQQLVQEKIKYTDVVLRHGRFFQPAESVIFVLTDQNLYIMRWEQDTEVKPASKMKLFGKKKAKVIAKVDQFGNPETKLVLKKKVPLGNIIDLQLSQLSDDLLKIGVNVDQPLQTPDKSNFVDKSKVKRCMESQEPFSFFGKVKTRCHYTGGIFVKELMSAAAVPEKGFYEQVSVLRSVSNKINTEMQEDIIIESEHKAEITSLLMDLVSRIRSGGGIEQAVQNNPNFGLFNQGFSNLGGSAPLEPSFANFWKCRGAEPLGFTFNNNVTLTAQSGIQQIMFQQAPDMSIIGAIPNDGISADRQRRLKEFLYRREERKRQKIQNRQMLNDQARANQQRFMQEDKALRAKQRAERRARRNNKNAGPVAKVQPSWGNNAGGGFPGAGGGFNQPPGIPSRNKPVGGGFNQPPAMPSRNKPTGGGFNQPPAMPNRNKPAGGGFNPPAAGGGFNKPSGGFGFNKPSGGGASVGFPKPAGGGFNKPATGGGFNKPSGGGFNKPAGGVATGFNMAAAGGFNKPSNGGSSKNFGFNKPSNGGNGGSSKNFGFNKPANGGNGGSSKNFGFNKPSNGGGSVGFPKPSGGGFNKPAGSGSSNNFGFNKPSNGGSSKNFGFNKPATGGAPASKNFGFNKPANGGNGSSKNFGFNKPATGGSSKNFGFNKPAAGGFDKPAGGGFKKPAGGVATGFNVAAAGGFNKPSGGSSKNFGFNKPAGGGFNKPSGGGFNKPSGGGFNKPSGGGFNKPAAGGFSKPAGGGFGFNKPAGGGFNKPAGGGFNKPAGGGFNKPAGGGGFGFNKPAATQGRDSGSSWGGDDDGNAGGGNNNTGNSKFQGPDWERVLDPNTNRYYFFNYKTEESVWDES